MPIADCQLPIVVRCAVVVRADAIKTQPGEKREEIQRHRQGILQFRDPCRRGGRHRVNREEQPGEPRARNAQAQQETPDERRGGGVKQHVDDVVAARIIPPEPPFHPEDAGGERKIVRRLRREPKPPQAVGRADQLVGIEEAVVVPEEPAAQHHGKVGEERDGHDGGGRKDQPPRRAPGIGGRVRVHAISPFQPLR